MRGSGGRRCSPAPAPAATRRWRRRASSPGGLPVEQPEQHEAPRGTTTMPTTARPAMKTTSGPELDVPRLVGLALGLAVVARVVLCAIVADAHVQSVSPLAADASLAPSASQRQPPSDAARAARARARVAERQQRTALQVRRRTAPPRCRRARQRPRGPASGAVSPSGIDSGPIRKNRSSSRAAISHSAIAGQQRRVALRCGATAAR